MSRYKNRSVKKITEQSVYKTLCKHTEPIKIDIAVSLGNFKI